MARLRDLVQGSAAQSCLICVRQQAGSAQPLSTGMRSAPCDGPPAARQSCAEGKKLTTLGQLCLLHIQKGTKRLWTALALPEAQLLLPAILAIW